MIYDLLANIGNYRGMNRNLDKAIDYLMTVDINTLPLGKTEIDGDRVFLQVMEARTHELTDESYEVHRINLPGPITQRPPAPAQAAAF